MTITPSSLRGRKTKVILGVLVIIVIGLTIFVLYNHFSQVSKAASLSNVMITPCHLTGPLETAVSSVTQGSSGTILFNCGSDPAINVVNAGTATPVFSLPQGYTELTLVAHLQGSSACVAGSIVLIPNQALNFTQTTSYDYCATYSNAPSDGLASFTLVWTRNA